MFRLYKVTLATLSEKWAHYTDTSKAQAWLDANVSRVKQLFEDVTLRDFIFEPFKGVFKTSAKTVDANVYSVITQVAVINMVLAGLPGKLGIGVWVSMALEGWMALTIARHVGVKVNRVSDIWKYFGMLTASAGIILYGFRTFLGIFFTAFSFIPGINPLIFAELVVTDLVGILFWIGFKEVANTGSFTIPKRLLKNVFSLTKGLVKHQYGILKNILTLDNIKLVGQRIAAYLKGDFPVDKRLINGETFSMAAMAYLLSGHDEKLQGPLGETFIEAIRLRWSSKIQPEDSVPDIAEHFRSYDTDQLSGAINTIKGKMFELMVVENENQDGDVWSAQMHTDESFPGSDIIFTSSETGEQIEVSLKAVAQENNQIIEHALVRYPDFPIMTTDEMAALYEGDERVFGSSILHEDLDNITNERLDELLSGITPLNAHEVVVGGVTMGMMSALWPFTMAYLRKKMTREQLTTAYTHVLGEGGVQLASRITYATLFGPLFAWYLLARGVKGMVLMMEPKDTRYIEFIKKKS